MKTQEIVIACLFLTVVMILGVASSTLSEVDATPPKPELVIYTDHQTGCQYVGTKSSITLRIDPEGYPICIKK